jgi:hypothetical protein
MRPTEPSPKPGFNGLGGVSRASAQSYRAAKPPAPGPKARPHPA